MADSASDPDNPTAQGVPGLDLLTYQRVAPVRDEQQALTVSATGVVRRLGGRGRPIGEWHLADDQHADVLERLTLALDDADFPNPPAATQVPDSTSLLVGLAAGGREAQVWVPSTARDDNGGWSELIRLLDSLMEQTEDRLGSRDNADRPDDGILPDCLT